MVVLKFAVFIVLIFCTCASACVLHFKRRVRNRVYAIPMKGLLPRTSECGPVLPTLKFDTPDVAIDDFPWNAVLKYQNKNSKEFDFLCGGFLVNARYVVTAAECISHRNFKLVGVRFGEYELYNKKDCVCLEMKDDICQIEDCADPPQDIGIESVKVHDHYSARSDHHNIALVRLDRSVNYTNFIAPICLPPISGGKEFFSNDEIFTIAGWGLSQNGHISTKKQITQVVPFNKTTCESQYNLRLRQSTFCAVGIFEESSCIGGSGGALAVLHFDDENSRLNWFVKGMKLPKNVTRTTSRAPTLKPEEHPCVYMDITKYNQWIISNMRDW